MSKVVYTRRLTEDELEELFTRHGSITTNQLSIQVKSILRQFSPPKRHWDELQRKWPERYESLQKYLADNPAAYSIPAHQRLYAWDDELASNYIHSLIIDLPVHNIIATTAGGRAGNDVEDGQHRLVSIWRFVNNLFAYRSPDTNIGFYYDAIPKCDDGKVNFYCLTMDKPRIRYELDNRQITLKVASGLMDEHRSIVFDYTNRGKHLKEADLIYAYIGSNAFMDFARKVCEEYGESLFKKHFGYDWTVIETAKRKHIQHLLALVGTLATSGVSEETNNVKRLDVINGQRKTAFHVLALEDGDIPKDQVYRGLDLLLAVFDGLSDAKGMGYRKDFMSKTSGLLGIMLFHMKENPEVTTDTEKSRLFIRYWVRIINKIREIPYSKAEDHWFTQFHVAEKGGANNIHGQVVMRRLHGLVSYAADTLRIHY